MADLPEEALLEILLRLPVKSLLRFKCVCKSWYALFDSLEFEFKHVPKQSKDHIILMHYCPHKGYVFSFLSNIKGDGGGDDDSCIVDLDLDLGFRNLGMVGQCDGIVALSDHDKEIILCNPTIREFRVLPKSSFHEFPRYPYQSYNPVDYDVALKNIIQVETCCVGFGYDPKTKDYKVVRVLAFRDHPDLDLAEVFLVREDSTWREINNAVIGVEVIAHNDLGTYFDGVYYWCAVSLFNEPLVLSFDMGDEVFQTTPMPDCCDFGGMTDDGDILDDFSGGNISQLGMYNSESIALFVYLLDGLEKCIDVWVLKEFGVKDSWTKQLTIGPLLGLQSPLVFWKNDKELLQEDANGQLVSYDLGTLESMNLSNIVRVQDLESLVTFPALTYMKTLVSVNKKG